MTTKQPLQSLQFPCGSVSIGDVFVSSWGYEQTNVFFYQVCALRGKMTVLLREIRAEVVSRDNNMGGEKKPRLNDFKDRDQLTRRIVSKYGRIEVRIEDFADAYLTQPDECHSFTSYH